MQKHSPVTFDFADHRLLICKEGKQVELKGMKEEMALKMISLKSVNRLISKGWKGVTSRLFVMISKAEENPKTTEVLPLFPSSTPLKSLLSTYAHIFQPPVKLPPTRSQ